MEKERNEAAVKRYVQEFGIPGLTGHTDLIYEVLYYQPGELLISPVRETSNFLFLVSGTVQIYYLTEDGEKSVLTAVNPTAMFGELEFVSHKNGKYFVEALTAVTCLALSMKLYGRRLYEDVGFLHFLLESLAFKLKILSREDTITPQAEDKLLYYLKHVYPDHDLKNLGTVASQVRCSRRHLHRMLNSLCERGVLEKTGRGKYRLVE